MPCTVHLLTRTVVNIFVSLTYQKLDDEAAAGLSRVEERNSEIDAGIDTIARGIENLASIGAAMKDEVRRLLFGTLCNIRFFIHA